MGRTRVTQLLDETNLCTFIDWTADENDTDGGTLAGA